ncbi:hypothetical protein QUF80_16705, partial [Desulfococcaceae bacterium HSG8]|nr:hypothetical protein [Desulfococcaceae bacterium HSG8]
RVNSAECKACFASYRYTVGSASLHPPCIRLRNDARVNSAECKACFASYRYTVGSASLHPPYIYTS